MKSFASFHPAALLLYFVCVAGIAMFTPSPVLHTLALLGGVLFCALLERSRQMLSSLAFYAALFVLITITNPLFSHNGATTLFSLRGNPVTLEAILYGADIAAMLIAVLYWCRALSAVMGSDKLLYLFGRPAPKLALLLSMTLRFIPLFKVRTKQVSDAQQAMGLFAEPGIRRKIQGALRVFSAMITWSLESAVDTGDAMKARGYGLPGRSHFTLFRFTRRDALLLASTAVLTAAVLTGTTLGFTAYYFYPTMTALRPGAGALATDAAFGLLCLLPFAEECKENLKWRYFVSKI